MTEKGTRKDNQKQTCNLLVACGGRCTMCNIDVMHDWLSHKGVKWFEKAHIFAFGDGGPRSSPLVPPIYRDSLENLTILCPSCHTIVDKAPEMYSVEFLKSLKNNKEARVRKMMDCLDNDKCKVVKYSSCIGSQNYNFSDNDIRLSTFNNGFFTEEEIINLSEGNNSENIARSIDTLKDNYENRIQRIVDNNSSESICLFALGPQPLLIYLGWLFGDKQRVKIFIKHRNEWRYNEDTINNPFTIVKPEHTSGDNIVVLALSITAEVNTDLIKECIGLNVDLWQIKLESETGIDMISNQNELSDFHKKSVSVLDSIGKEYGKDKKIIVIPIVCNALAIEFGRSIMHKSHNPIDIYDTCKKIKLFMKENAV